jgi:hypothetical protein
VAGAHTLLTRATWHYGWGPHVSPLAPLSEANSALGPPFPRSSHGTEHRDPPSPLPCRHGGLKVAPPRRCSPFLPSFLLLEQGSSTTHTLLNLLSALGSQSATVDAGNQSQCRQCSKLPNMLSQMFFSICITSKLCRTSNVFQHGSSKNNLLPPVVPSSFFFVLLPLFLTSCQISLIQNFHTIAAPVCQLVAQRLPGFHHVIEVDYVLVPPMVHRQKAVMPHVAMFGPIFQPYILSIYVTIWTCKLAFRAPTR